MRRWEYVEGTASKFWETGAEGAVVTVRYGRCGSNGRTQTKEYASAEAAAEQVLKAIAEKEKKGYREVAPSDVPAAPAAGDAPAAPDTPPAAKPPVLPDEDTFTLPATWKSILLPRRGGCPRVPSGVAPGTFEKIDADVTEQASWIQRFIDSPDSDPGLADQLRAHVAGSPSPVGAALLTSIVPLSVPDSAWAHLWTERYGLPFAACAAAEMPSVEATWQQSGRSRTLPKLQALARPHHAYWMRNRRPVTDRVRALLAAADEDTYRAAVAALADRRTDAVRKVSVSYLVPSETDWVDELCADPQVLDEHDDSLLTMLFSSLYSGDQVTGFTRRPPLAYNAALVATLAEGIGTAVAPLLADQLKDGAHYADAVKAAAESLAEIPTDEAFLALLAHADLRHVRPALLEAMRRCPVRATRLLAHASRNASGSAADRTRQLIRGHLATCREVVSLALGGLDAEVVEVVEPLLNPVGLVPDAPADALPEVLTTPPWSRPRVKAKPLVVTGLTAESAPSVEWLPGEREAWAATTSWYTTERTGGRWAGWDVNDPAVQHDLRGDHLSSAWLYVHGPEELVAPYLATWDPTDLWDAEDTFKPIAARFGLAALPLLLRAAPRQPASLAPVLLPFVDVGVARHMADWAVRLKSVAATARSWFARHGAVAAPLLVPDAVGKAGPARRAAEQALTLISSLHGDEAVREAAGGVRPRGAGRGGGAADRGSAGAGTARQDARAPGMGGTRAAAPDPGAVRRCAASAVGAPRADGTGAVQVRRRVPGCRPARRDGRTRDARQVRLGPVRAVAAGQHAREGVVGAARAGAAGRRRDGTQAHSGHPDLARCGRPPPGRGGLGRPGDDRQRRRAAASARDRAAGEVQGTEGQSPGEDRRGRGRTRADRGTALRPPGAGPRPGRGRFDRRRLRLADVHGRFRRAAAAVRAGRGRQAP
ncbi:WGR domain-containing protein [Streptomyces sp. NPDC002476]|uniref:WGR domain-containing protein n=1 Tax=Streptomyces sp. NPDC002476 TaxID=3364648 RepID=UPI0036B9673A